MSRLKVLLVLASSLPTVAFAADLPSVYAPPPAAVPTFVYNSIIRANNQISLDFSSLNFDYAEYGNPERGTAPGLANTERAWLPGLSLNGSIMRDFIVDNAYFSGEFNYNSGKTNYIGSFIGEEYGSLRQKNKAEMIDFDFRVGKGFSINPSVMLTPFVAVGSHNWMRTLPGEGGYKADYNNGYVGGGLLAQFSPFSRTVISASGLAGTTFDSSVKITNLPVGLDPFTARLGDRVIYKLGLSGDYAITDAIHVNAGVEYTDFHYGQSKILPVNGGVFEPNSRTSNTRLKIGFGYAY